MQEPSGEITSFNGFIPLASFLGAPLAVDFRLSIIIFIRHILLTGFHVDFKGNFTGFFHNSLRV